MRRAMIIISATVLVALVGPQPFAAAADAADHRPPGTSSVRVGGAVGAPATYSTAEIAALPQVTLPSRRFGRPSHEVTGASLEAVVALSNPVLPPGKNTQLRESITVVGQRGSRVTMALGELTADFGNHPALLQVDPRGQVDLVVPGDSTPLRSVGDVRSILVTVSDAVADALPATGSVRVRSGQRSVDLSAALLNRLPQRTVTVSFLAGSTAQSHTESGPSLVTALLAAGILPVPDTVVTAVGADGYGAAVTTGEAILGGRPLLISLHEDGAALSRPRLIAVGDVRGGRDVSGVVVLAVTRSR